MCLRPDSFAAGDDLDVPAELYPCCETLWGQRARVKEKVER
jgi:hypothetical protein